MGNPLSRSINYLVAAHFSVHEQGAWHPMFQYRQLYLLMGEEMILISKEVLCISRGSYIVIKYPNRTKCCFWFYSSATKQTFSHTGNLEGWWWCLLGYKCITSSSVFSKEEARVPQKATDFTGCVATTFVRPPKKLHSTQ